MKFLEVTLVDENGKKVKNSKVSLTYKSGIEEVISKIAGKDYKIYSGITDLNGICRFNGLKEGTVYTWFGVQERKDAKVVECVIKNSNFKQKIKVEVEGVISDYKVNHIFNFNDVVGNPIPKKNFNNKLGYKVSINRGLSWGSIRKLINPLIIKSFVGQEVRVKLYLNFERGQNIDILKSVGKNYFKALKCQNVGDNILQNINVPIKYMKTKTGANRPVIYSDDKTINDKCLSGFIDCPCQTYKVDKDGFVENNMVDNSEKIDSSKVISQPTAIILHRTAGWSAVSSINSGRLNKAVAHFYICSGLNGIAKDGSFKKIETEGKIYQALSLNSPAGHMGVAQYKLTKEADIGNHNTLSIEVCGMYSNESWHEVSDKQAKSLACLLTALMNAYGLGYDKVHFHEDLCAKTDYEGRLPWISSKKYLKNPPKGSKEAPYRDSPFKVSDKYPVEK